MSDPIRTETLSTAGIDQVVEALKQRLDIRVSVSITSGVTVGVTLLLDGEPIADDNAWAELPSVGYQQRGW